MSTLETRSLISDHTLRLRQSMMAGTNEVLAYCPKCKTFETLCFTGGVMVPTRKFYQNSNQVYHDCSSEEPCRLFPYFMKKG